MCLYLVSLCYLCFGFFGLTRLLTSYRTSTKGSGVMRCDVMLMLFDLNLLKPNHGNVMACSMMCVVYWLLLLSSLPVWSWDICIWDTLLNHFWVINQLYLDYFSVAMMGLKCLLLILMMSCCDMFDLTILGVFDQCYFWILFGCLLRTEVYFDLLWDIFSGCLLRTDGYCDLSFDAFQLLVENWCDIMIIFMMLSSHLYRVEVIMWFVISWA